MVNPGHKDRQRKEFDHTGDLGIDVRGESLDAVFEEAALGMFALLTQMEDVAPTDAFAVDASGDDNESLLLNWLSELNFLHLTERLVFSRFEIKNISTGRIESIAFGEPIDPARHTLYTEIKAVTYHDLIVEKRNDVWHARIIFDI